MNGLKLQAKAYRGYAKSARKVGLQHHHFRPASATLPLDAANALTDLPVLIERHMGKFRYDAPEVHGKPYRDAIADGTLLAVGDYLVPSDGRETMFVAAMQPIEPILLVTCNAVVSIVRTPKTNSVGASSGYSGVSRASEQTLISGWPCSLVMGGGGERSTTMLPSEPRSDQGMAVMLPSIPGGLQFDTGMSIVDEQGVRYLVVGVEHSSMGWRLTVVRTTA